MRPVKRPDPAPSRIAFRLKRLWRSRRFRRAVTRRGPLVALLAALGWAGAQPELRDRAVETVASWREGIAARPEFAVRRIEVRGAGPEVAAEVRATLAPWLGTSSLSADAGEIRAAVAALGWVKRAEVRLSAPEALIVSVTERVPALIWRTGGALSLLDRAGARIAPLAARAERPALPVIAGAGANAAAPEARAIIAAAAEIGPALRGLVRIGERRWNVVFVDAPTVMLPGKGALDAMGYLAALQAGEDVMGRDVSRIDLRIGVRPTLRLRSDAVEALDAARHPDASRRAGEDA